MRAGLVHREHVRPHRVGASLRQAQRRGSPSQVHSLRHRLLVHLFEILRVPDINRAAVVLAGRIGLVNRPHLVLGVAWSQAQRKSQQERREGNHCHLRHHLPCLALLFPRERVYPSAAGWVSSRASRRPHCAWNSYSCRSVFIGSTLAARLAGIHAANRHATTITSRLERYATGSVTCTISEIIAPTSVASTSVANDAASPAPASSPNRTGRVVCANINCVTF